MSLENQHKMLALTKLKEKIAQKKVAQESFFEIVGSKALKLEQNIVSLLEFIGDITFSFGRLIKGKAFFCLADFLLIIQKCGIEALFLVRGVEVKDNQIAIGGACFFIRLPPVYLIFY